MAFPYKNPTSLTTLSAPEGVSLTSTQGTNFSVSQVGGYMEVYYLENLGLTFSGTGAQTLSANTIPIVIAVQPNAGLQFTQLTLNSDNISSGRRRLGMQVYVQETDTVYQYTIPNYDFLWASLTGLTGSSAITQSSTFTTVNARSQSGKDFINAWTGSTIEGVNGVTKENARWKIFWGSDVQITGGTYYSGTSILDLYNNTGGTISVSGFTAPITGGTYNSGSQTLALNSAGGSSIQITGFTSGGGGNPLTVYDATSGVTVSNVTGMTFSGASVINNGGGSVTINFTGGTGTSGSSGTSGTS